MTYIPASAVVVNTGNIADNAVTYAKIQDVSAASKLLGRGDSGSGDVQEITLGANLTMTGTTLAASGGGISDGDKGDITVSSSGTVWTVDSGAISLAKMADVATSTVFYRKTAGTGAPEVQTLATLKADLNLSGTNTGDQTITLTGDVTGSGTGSFAATIANSAVTLAKMADIATNRIIGRETAGTGAPESLTTTQVTAMLHTFTSGAQGVVPASGGGTTNYLRADGTWTAPTASAAWGSITGTLSSQTDLQTALDAKVAGPGSATDNAIARYDSTTGKLIQNSAATVNDDGVIRSATNSGANAVAVPLANWVKLTADYTLTSSTSEQKFFNTTTNGTLTLPTGMYRFRWFAYLTTMSATSGNAAFDPIGAGSAVTDRWEQHVTGIDNTTPLSVGTRTGSAAVAQQTVASAVTATTGTGMVAHINGSFRISTGGTIIPSITLVTAAAAVAKAGSFFIVEKIGESSENYVGAWT